MINTNYIIKVLPSIKIVKGLFKVEFEYVIRCPHCINQVLHTHHANKGNFYDKEYFLTPYCCYCGKKVDSEGTVNYIKGLAGKQLNEEQRKMLESFYNYTCCHKLTINTILKDEIMNRELVDYIIFVNYDFTKNKTFIYTNDYGMSFLEKILLDNNIAFDYSKYVYNSNDF